MKWAVLTLCLVGLVAASDPKSDGRALEMSMPSADSATPLLDSNQNALMEQEAAIHLTQSADGVPAAPAGVAPALKKSTTDVSNINLYFDELSNTQKKAFADKWEFAAMLSPPGASLWKEFKEKKTNTPYYYNIVTKTSVWKKPDLTKLARDFDLAVDTPASYRAPSTEAQNPIAEDRNYCAPYLCMNNQPCHKRKCRCDADWDGDLCHIPSLVRRNRLFREAQDSPEFAIKAHNAVKQRTHDGKMLEKKRSLFKRTMPTTSKYIKAFTDPKDSAYPPSKGETDDTLPGPRDDLHQLGEDVAWRAQQAMADNHVSPSMYNKFKINNPKVDFASGNALVKSSEAASDKAKEDIHEVDSIAASFKPIFRPKKVKRVGALINYKKSVPKVKFSLKYSRIASLKGFN